MVKVKTWDTVDYIDSEEDAIAYLNAAAELNDPAVLQAALGDVARARGMGKIAQEVQVGRESLYKSLAESGNPSFKTIMNVVAALGGRIVIQPAYTNQHNLV